MNEKFCQVCRGAWPDHHEPWCPVLTGEAQAGNPNLSQLYNAQMQQAAAQNMLSSSPMMVAEVEFVGGPLDGNNPVHQMQNSRLQIEGDVSGYYMYLADGRYHWIKAQ